LPEDDDQLPLQMLLNPPTYSCVVLNTSTSCAIDGTYDPNTIHVQAALVLDLQLFRIYHDGELRSSEKSNFNPFYAAISERMWGPLSEGGSARWGDASLALRSGEPQVVWDLFKYLNNLLSNIELHISAFTQMLTPTTELQIYGVMGPTNCTTQGAPGPVGPRRVLIAYETSTSHIVLRCSQVVENTTNGPSKIAAFCEEYFTHARAVDEDVEPTLTPTHDPITGGVIPNSLDRKHIRKNLPALRSDWQLNSRDVSATDKIDIFRGHGMYVHVYMLREDGEGVLESMHQMETTIHNTF
jgi:hypothetical protein